MCWLRKKEPWWDRVIAELYNRRKTLFERQFIVRGLYDWVKNGKPCFDDDAHRRIVVNSLIDGLRTFADMLQKTYFEVGILGAPIGWITPAAKELYELCGNTQFALRSLLGVVDRGTTVTVDFEQDCSEE